MKNPVTVDELRRLMPRLSLATAGVLLPHLNAAMLEFAIVSKPRRCAFLAQLAHESTQLRDMEEIWGPTPAQKGYEGRADLGNTQPGDGKRYKGRGPIQLTGRGNYRRFGRLLGLDLEGNPELATKLENAFRIAALFWKLGGLNELADKLTLAGDAADRNVFTQITKRINGGTNGLTDRLNYFRIATQVLHGDEVPIADPAPLPAPIAPPTAAPQAGPPAPVAESTEPDADLLDAAVSSTKTKALWPRLVKHASAGGTFLWALMEAHKVAGVLVLIVIAAGLAWLGYHNRKRLTPLVIKVLK